MSVKSRICLRVSIALCALWAAVLITVAQVEASRPSERNALNFLQTDPLTARTDNAGRTQWMETMGVLLNRMDPDERHRLMLTPHFRQQVDLLSEDDKASFLRLTIPQGFQAMMTGFDSAPAERRRRWITQALNEITAVADGSEEGGEEAMIDVIEERGLTAAWRDSTPAARLHLQVLAERIQGILQVPR